MPTARVKAAERKQVATPPLQRWKLEDAKARLSEVVRRAAEAGPQMVTVRGREAAVILAPEQYRQLLPPPRGRHPLSRFLQGLGLREIDVERERDTGREIAL